MSTRVFVGNVNPTVTVEDLESHFSDTGDVLSVTIPVDRERGTPRGFAFVEFRSFEQAEEAIEAFDGSTLEGRRLRLSLANDARRGSRDRRGGRYRGSSADSDERDYRGAHGRRFDDDEDYTRERWAKPKKGRHGSDRQRGRGVRRRLE